MNYLRSLPASTALVAVLFAAGAAEATVRKCTTTRSGVAVILGAPPVFVLNGKNMGFIPTQGSAPPQSDDASADHFVLPGQMPIPAEEVLSIQVTCMEFTEGESVVGRQVIAVVTRSGAVGFMRSHLQDLSALQEEHRALTGAYAASLSDLNFFASRAPLPIELTVQSDTWAARVEIEGFSTSCSIQGGRQESIVSCGSGEIR